MQPLEYQFEAQPHASPDLHPSYAESCGGDAENTLPISSEPNEDCTENSQEPQPPAGMMRSIVAWSVAAVLGAAALLAATGNRFYANSEEAHSAWTKHLQPLAEHNAGLPPAARQLKQVSPAGVASFVNAVSLGAEDIDEQTTRAVVAQLQAGNEAEALRQISIQGQPQISLTSGMRSELLSGDARFYHLFLYDCCIVDGDVVEVLINGEPFATVPITNRGATLSVPAGQGTQISLRGIRDGVGGITVACRTSQGDFFMSAMAVGEEQIISLVR